MESRPFINLGITYCKSFYVKERKECNRRRVQIFVWPSRDGSVAKDRAVPNPAARRLNPTTHATPKPQRSRWSRGRRMVVARRPRKKRCTRKEEKKEGAPAVPPTRPTCACKTDAATAIRRGRALPRTAYDRGDADHQRGGQDIVRRYSRDGASEGPARGDRRRVPRN
jgi:hypothetical protein